MNNATCFGPQGTFIGEYNKVIQHKTKSVTLVV